MPKRDFWVDYAKAIGIILVVYGHVAHGLFKAGIWQGDTFYHLVDSVIYTFHMPLFFFLSGLFFKENLFREGKRLFVLKKLDCIVYPFVIWTVIQGAIEVEMAMLSGAEGDFSQILRSLYYPQNHLWFLYTLFLVFLISAFIFSGNDSGSMLPLPLLGVLAVLYVLEGQNSDVFPVNYIAENFVFFALGIILYERKGWIEKLSFMHAVILFGLFAVLQITFHDVFHYTYLDRGFFSLLVAISGILFVVSVSVLLSRYQQGFLVYLGQSSMVIYLMHVLSYSIARLVLVRFFGNENLLLHLVVGCLAGLFIPLMAQKVIVYLHLNFLFQPPGALRVSGLMAKSFPPRAI